MVKVPHFDEEVSAYIEGKNMKDYYKTHHHSYCTETTVSLFLVSPDWKYVCPKK